MPKQTSSAGESAGQVIDRHITFNTRTTSTVTAGESAGQVIDRHSLGRRRISAARTAGESAGQVIDRHKIEAPGDITIVEPANPPAK